jgi:2',3'-cyclic-nucleotide 2'-phosphodiesterase (5'-nucleotidase family)
VLLLAIAAGALSACTEQTTNQPNLQGQDVHLTILHTADIHSRIFSYEFAPNKFDQGYGDLPAQGPFGGAARLATLLKRERARSSRVIHLDSGDCFEGAPVFNAFSGEAEMRAMTQLGVDAAALGNHEFDLGANNLAGQISHWAGFPILAANYLFNDYTTAGTNDLGQVIHPYTILNVDGLTVGVLGMGNLSALNSIVQGGNSLGVTPLDTDQTTDYYTQLLRPQVDILVAVSHLGLDEDEDTALTSEGQTSNNQVQVRGDVDVVFGGHLHIVLDPPALIPVVYQDKPTNRNTVLVHSGAFAKTYGRLDLVVHVNTPAEMEAEYQQQVANKQSGQSVLPPRRGYVKAFDYHIEPVVARQLVDNDECVIPDEDQSGNSCTYDPTGAMGTCYYTMNPEHPTERQTCSISSPTACSLPGDMCLPCQYCHIPEDVDMNNLLEPYNLKLNMNYDLTRVFADAAVPTSIARKNTSGGDSQLGNLVASAMQFQQNVQADFSLTNALGIRADFDPGPLTEEEIFNVFPFNNTIEIIYLSGTEVQEMFDFVAQVSATRGCQTQAQISGAAFVMDCIDSRSDLIMVGTNRSCQTNAQCTVPGPDGQPDSTESEICGVNLGFCEDADTLNGGSRETCLFKDESHPDAPPQSCPIFTDLFGKTHQQVCVGSNLPVCGKVLNPEGSYRVAVNNYIAQGGSGFQVLAESTAKTDTGISLRDALIDYMQRLDDPTFEGPYGCTNPGDASTCHGAIRCNDPRWADTSYAELQANKSVPAATAVQYGCTDKATVNACLGNIICVLPRNQATNGRITPRLQ